MLVSHAHQFMFFRVPKTASTTVYRMLVNSGIEWDHNAGPARQGTAIYAHYTPNEAIAAGIITQEQVDTYDCYAFFRDPVQRFASMCTHILPESLPQDFTDFATRFWHQPGGAVDVDTGELGPPIDGPGGTFDKQQVDYLPCTFLPFEDLENQINFLFTRLGLEQPTIEWYNKKGVREYDPKELFDASPAARANITRWWPQDFAEWQQRRQP